MKNEIGRKLTSLTIMAIMFAGGMAIGVPSFMPEAASDLSSTDGMLTVSTTTLQGSAILEIVVNDPDVSDTTIDINSGPSVDVGGTSLDMSQAVNGKWYLYVVDATAAVLAEASASTASGLEYGVLCTGLAISETTTNYIIGTGTSVYAAAGKSAAAISLHAGGCQDIDGMSTTLDGSTTTDPREDLTDAVLANAPALSNHNDATAGQSDIDLGQLGHGLNSSGYGSWPYIVAQDLNADTIVSYGGDSVTVTYGDTTDETSISLTNQNPSDNTNVHITITDPALNIDPTTADTWEFGRAGTDATPVAYFATNGTGNTVLSGPNLNELDFGDNGFFNSDSASYIVANTGADSTNALTSIGFAETGANTGVFESFDATGAAEFLTIPQCAGDSITKFSYGGNTVDMICTYNDATITMGEAGQAWAPATAVTISVNDPDANKNPTSAETLAIGDETQVIPTIKMGSPLTLAQSGTNTNLAKNDADHVSGVVVGCGEDCTASGGGMYDLAITNVTDNSERMRIVLSAEQATHVLDVTTWINVTTGHTRATLVGLAGSVVLNYDVTGPCALVTCTAVSVYLTDSGENSTNNSSGLISINTSGNDQAGVYDLNDQTSFIVDTETTASDTFSSASNGEAGSVFVSVNFKLTHAAGNDLDADADFAIAADFCNFDQNNGSLVHNCIYRLEAEETGANTGIFEGSVEYINLVNSTSSNGGHDGNGNAVSGMLGYVNGDALSVVLMDAVSGSDSVRVVYNDTDAFQIATKIGAQLETSVHTGTVDLDADTYGVSDIGTITITDADLNQDSSIRDTYTNSSTTFQVTISTTSGSTTTSQKPFSSSSITAIETGPSTGVFVATFLVPNFKGADMEVEYFEAKDSASSAVSFYDTATIVSNTGSVSLDRNVYPVPFTTGDLSDGAGNLGSGTGANDEAGTVTAWITVTDIDETGDTMTVGGTSVGAIAVTIGGTTCFTAGGLSSYDADALAAESGPLSETVIGSSVYETSVSLTEGIDCGATDVTIQSGNVIQVAYTDQADDSGSSSTQFDSSTFDLRTGSLSVDKDVYVLGSDMVITLTDPDLNLDSASYETYVMGIIEWDSAASSSSLLSLSVSGTHAGFSSNPSSIEETGSDTGVFQTVTTLPSLEVTSDGTDIAYGEAVTLTYVDVGLSGENSVGDDTLDVEAYFSISNFGALIELDKAVYGWTDTVYVTITAPDHNTNSAAEETIGTSDLPIQASTRAGKMCTTASSKYFIAAETGPDTGIFTSEIGLTGYTVTNLPSQNDPTPVTACSQSDSTANTIITKGQTDGISVSYEYTDAVVVVASASIMWSIGEASFDTSSASAGGSAVLSVTDPDENTDGNVIQTVTADIYSDSDNGGFSLTMTETDEDTGVFEGTVFFTTDAATSGSNLRVSEGDTVTAEYSDATLPEPYTDSDTLTLASTLTIGTAFPPLERAPAANARVVDAFGASVAEVTVDQQVQIAADVSNGQSKDQAFAYLVQVQDENGVTVSLAWITGSLTAGQSMSPALSWTPSASGSYTATVFVWESVDNPTALSPTTSVTIDVV